MWKIQETLLLPKHDYAVQSYTDCIYITMDIRGSVMEKNPGVVILGKVIVPGYIIRY